MAKGMAPDVYPRVNCIAVCYLPTTEVSAGCDCYSVSLQDRYSVDGIILALSCHPQPTSDQTPSHATISGSGARNQPPSASPAVIANSPTPHLALAPVTPHQVHP